MTGERKGILHNPIFLVFGIILAAILFFGVFFYLLHAIRWGPCLANAVDIEMAKIVKGFNKLETTTGTVPVSITIGECVWGLFFVSEDGMKEFKKNAGVFKDDIKCSGSSIVIMPYFESKERIWELKFWKIPENIWLKAKDWWAKNAKGIKPQCRSLDHDVNSLTIEGPGEGKSKTVCLELSRVGEGEKYKYMVKEVTCENA